MKEAIEVMRSSVIDEVTGSVFWWPHGMEYKRSLTRCSQGQGAWAWQYLEQWLGLQVSQTTHTLTIAPRGMLTSFEWQGFCSGENQFDLEWVETSAETSLKITNHNNQTWTIQAGFRGLGSGASANLIWQNATVEPNQECYLRAVALTTIPQEMTEAEIQQLEVAAFSQDPDVLFKRYGPAMLWGHWDSRKSWINAELPNALRFIIANNTSENWQNVEVILTCPEGWSAMGRQTLHWPLPDDLQPGEIHLALGTLANMSKTVAPFWVQAPGGRGLLSPLEGPPFSLHLPSQTGEGVQLADPMIKQSVAVKFTAELQATTLSGKLIQKMITIPVEVVPG